jgi:hypothetical protein
MATLVWSVPDPQALLNSVAAIDPKLAQMLPERDSLAGTLSHLDATTGETTLMDEAFERRRLWQDAGLFYAHSTRLRDAIEFFSHMHEKISEVRAKQQSWIPCGMPLVWISDFYLALNCPHLAFRYLLLSGISDAIRDQGHLDPKAGFYWRARWRGSLSDEEISRFYSHAFAEYQKRETYCQFPEFILSKVGTQFPGPYPSTAELDIYRVNSTYAGVILSNIDAAQKAKGKVDGKDLEGLAGYLLSCIPGFEVTLNIVTGDSQVDALIRNRGPRFDFRDDLGTYIVVECKDWSKAVGSKEVGWFVNKLLTQECRAGILFSSMGITGDAKARSDSDVRYAALTLLKAYQRAGKIVMVLDREYFNEAVNGNSLIRLLQNAYEEVRFDVRSQAQDSSRPAS